MVERVRRVAVLKGGPRGVNRQHVMLAVQFQLHLDGLAQVVHIVRLGFNLKFGSDIDTVRVADLDPYRRHPHLSYSHELQLFQDENPSSARRANKGGVFY